MTRMAAGETQNAETIESRADAAQLYRLAKRIPAGCRRQQRKVRSNNT